MSKIFKRIAAMSAAVMMMSANCIGSSAASSSASGTVKYNNKTYNTSASVTCNRWDASSETYINGPSCTSISTAVTYKYLDNQVGYKYVTDHAERSSGGGKVIAKAYMPTACQSSPNRYRSISASSTHGVTYGTRWTKSLSTNY